MGVELPDQILNYFINFLIKKTILEFWFSMQINLGEKMVGKYCIFNSRIRHISPCRFNWARLCSFKRIVLENFLFIPDHVKVQVLRSPAQPVSLASFSCFTALAEISRKYTQGDESDKRRPALSASLEPKVLRFLWLLWVLAIDSFGSFVVVVVLL